MERYSTSDTAIDFPTDGNSEKLEYRYNANLSPIVLLNDRLAPVLYSKKESAGNTTVLEILVQQPDVKRIFVTSENKYPSESVLKALNDTNIELIIVQLDDSGAELGDTTQGSHQESVVPSEATKPEYSNVTLLTVREDEVGKCILDEYNERSQLTPLYGDAAYDDMTEVSGKIAEAGAIQHAHALSRRRVDITGESWVVVTPASNDNFWKINILVRKHLDLVTALDENASRLLGHPHTAS